MGGEVVHLLDDGGRTWLVPASANETAGQALTRAQSHGVAGSPTTLAILRRSHAADGAAPPADVVRVLSLGHKVVALATLVVQDAVQACVVDVYQVTGSTGVGACVAQGVPLPEFWRSQGWSVWLCPDVTAAPEVSSAAVQSSGHVLMVAPSAFQSNAQAAEDNAFMAASGGNGIDDGITAAALAEHAGLVAALSQAGVRVHVFSHSYQHGTPDAVFPNNWFAAAADGTLALFPMRNPNRAAERRQDLVAWLQGRPGWRRTLDWTATEREAPPRVVEGTGSLVIDHLHRTAYLCRSERSDEALAKAMAAELGLSLLAFDATDSSGRAIYHTNVLLAIGTGVAVVCDEAIPEGQREGVVQALRAGGSREVVCITRQQMCSFCGNVLEVQAAGLPVLAMSTAAHRAFTGEQKAVLLRHVARLVHAPLDTIERVGGGGVRCCIGELFH